jgi:hypothetical protein
MLFYRAVLADLDGAADARCFLEALREKTELDIRMSSDLRVHALHRARGETEFPVVERRRQKTPDPWLVPVERRDEADGGSP